MHLDVPYAARTFLSICFRKQPQCILVFYLEKHTHLATHVQICKRTNLSKKFKRSVFLGWSQHLEIFLSTCQTKVYVINNAQITSDI